MVMTILEEVIYAIECHLSDKYKACDKCGHPCQEYDTVTLPSNLVSDALILLKTQEPIKPLKMEVNHVRKKPIVFSYQCAVCMTGLQRHWIACPNCGQVVKW